jgi:hypothetical protein
MLTYVFYHYQLTWTLPIKRRKKEAEKRGRKRGRKIVNAHYRINSPKRRIEIPKSNGHKFD